MHRHFVIVSLVASFGLGLSLTTPAFAEDAAGKACGADYQKFCAGVQAGEGRIGRCLMQHHQELSSACQTYLTQATQTLIQQFVAACQQDVVQHCNKVQPGQGRVLNCLREHRDALSSACQQLIEKL
jgi:hypothetical protein